MQRPIAFGIVGTGVIADFHARAIAATDGAQLAGVFSRDPAKAADFATRHGTHAAASLEDLLAMEPLDAVCVTTPSGAHAEPSIAALRAGKHVLCEKPLEVTRERVEAILSAAKESGRILAAVFPMRLGDGPQRVKKAIEQGRFGRLTLCSCSVKWWRSQEYYDQGGWRGTRKLDGGGALMNQGIHFIDLLQWLVGMPDSVQAQTATLAHERIEVEDTAVATLHFPNGALGVIEGATSAWPGQSARIEICGDKGWVVLENDRIAQWKFADETPEDEQIRQENLNGAFGSGASDPKAIGIEGHRRHIEDLVKAIRSGGQPAIQGDEARNAIDLILSIYESAERQSVIRL